MAKTTVPMTGDQTRRLILHELQRRELENIRPPSIRELMVAIGRKSVASVQWHLAILLRQGLVEEGETRQRGVTYRLKPKKEKTKEGADLEYDEIEW